MNNASSTTLRSSELTDFGPSYFDHVLAEFELVRDGKISPTVDDAVHEILERHKNRARLTWGDLYLLEKYVIKKQPPEVVKARLLSLRLHYRGIVGADAYELYLKSGHAAHLDGRPEDLRADAGRLLDALHWVYAMAPEREHVRTCILKSIFLEMSISVGLGIAAALLAAFFAQTLVATIILVLLMGAMGGFLSVQQRIQRIPPEQDPILSIFELQNGRFAVHLAPLTGAMCAVVLFLIFQAELLKGALFPDMQRITLMLGHLQNAPFQLVINGAGPFAEFGKLLVWCFIAGFAERLVPDTLDSFGAKRDQARAARDVLPVVTEPISGKPTIPIRIVKTG